MLAVLGNRDAINWATLGVVLLVAAVVGVFLVAGLFSARSLIRREFSAYFLSPVGYVVLVVFLGVTGYLFYLTVAQLTASGPRGVEYPLQSMFGDDRFWLVFLFIPPLLTMRLFAEERASGTLEVLLTAPLRDWQVVLSKYLACFAFYVVLWLPTLAYLPVLLDLHVTAWQPVWTPWTITASAGLAGLVLGALLLLPPLGTTGRLASLALLALGAVALAVGGVMHYRADPVHFIEVTAGIDPMPVLSSYLGLMLAGAMFLAVGLLVSSLVRDQMVAALVSLVLGLVFIAAGFWHLDQHLDTGSLLYQAIYFISVPLHFAQHFSRGLVDSRPLVLYSSVTLFCLFLTVRSVESRRWR